MSRRARSPRAPRPPRTTPLTRRLRGRGWSDPRAATNVAIGLTIALERVHGEGRIHGHITPESVSLRQDGGVVLHAPAPPSTSADVTDDRAVTIADTDVSGDPGTASPEADPVLSPFAPPPEPSEPAGVETPIDPGDPGDQPTVTFPSPIGSSAPVRPEDREPASRDDDIHAVGALLYSMLTGAAAPTGDEDADRAVLARRNDLPDEVTAVVIRAIHPNPLERYHSAEHLHADLDAARASLPSRTARGSRAPRSSRPARGPGGRGRAIALVVVLLAAIAAGLWYFVLREDSVTVPNVVGQTSQEAERMIRDAGLEPLTEQEWSSSVPSGFVIRTDPEGGRSRTRGGSVTLVVSGTGGDSMSEIVIPDVVGQQESDALVALQGAGLSPSVSRMSDSQPEGTVIRIEPSASTRVSSGSTVTVTVSSGPSGVTTPTGETDSTTPDSSPGMGTTSGTDTTTDPGTEAPFLDEPDSSTQGTDNSSGRP